MLPLLSVSEAAQELGVSRGIIHIWMQTGKLKGEKVGAVFVIPRESVDALKLARESPEYRKSWQTGFKGGKPRDAV